MAEGEILVVGVFVGSALAWVVAVAVTCNKIIIIKKTEERGDKQRLYKFASLSR